MSNGRTPYGDKYDVRSQLRREVSDFLDTLFTKGTEARSQQNLQLGNWLLQNATLQQQQNINQMRELGLSLKDVDQTSNLEYFLENGGDDSTMAILGNLYGQAIRNNQLMDQSLATHQRGKLASQQLIDAGAAEREYYDYEVETDGVSQPTSYIEGDIDDSLYADLILDPTEIEALAKKGDIDPEDYVNEVYMQGFKQGLRSEEDAMAMLQADLNLRNASLAFNKGQIDIAKKTNDANMGLIGNTIVNGIVNSGTEEVLGIKGILNVEGGSERFGEIVEHIVDSKAYPNIQNEFIGALNAYAGIGEEWDVHRGFINMASNAYGVLQIINQKEKQAIIDGTFGFDKDPFIGLTPNEIEILRSTDAEYDLAYAKFLEYQNIGIPLSNEKVMQQAYMSGQLESNIIDANEKLIYGELDKVSEELGISRDYLYQNIEWVEGDSYNNMVNTIAAENAAQVADTEVLSLSEEITQGEFEDVLSWSGVREDKQQEFLNKILDPDSDIYSLIQSGKDTNQAKSWRRLENALNDYAELHRTSQLEGGESWKRLEKLSETISELVDHLGTVTPGLFRAQPFRTWLGRGY